MRGKEIEISPGDRFGTRTVIGLFAKDRRSHRFFRVKCDCGEIWVHRLDFLLERKDGRPCRYCKANGHQAEESAE